MCQRLVARLGPGMLVLCDRNLTTTALPRQIAASGAQLWGAARPTARCRRRGTALATGPGCRSWAGHRLCHRRRGHHHHPRRPRHRRLPAGHHPDRPPAGPAATLVALDHQRGAVETAYLELKSSILGGRVLRARTPAGVDQQVHALLVCYQLLRLAMADATSTQPGTDPDRASFTIALQAARDQLIQAAGVLQETVIDLVGKIGRAVLANPLPDRRLRVAPRIVKRAITNYNPQGPTINPTSYKATLSIDIHCPPSPLTTRPGPQRPGIAASPVG
jgi:hypothetical protein